MNDICMCETIARCHEGETEEQASFFLELFLITITQSAKLHAACQSCSESLTKRYREVSSLLPNGPYHLVINSCNDRRHTADGRYHGSCLSTLNSGANAAQCQGSVQSGFSLPCRHWFELDHMQSDLSRVVCIPQLSRSCQLLVQPMPA